jgi:hypothetical protein
MTGLKQLLEDEANTQMAPLAPVERIVKAGRTRVQRRRAGGIAAAACLVVMGAVLVPSLGTVGGGEPPAVDRSLDGATLASEGVAWADADTVHYRGVEARRPPWTFSLTSTASAAVYVSTPPSDAGGRDATIRTLDADGEVREIGTSNWNNLVHADATGSLVAWVEAPADAAGDLELKVYDTGSNEMVARRSMGAPTRTAELGQPFVVGVDGDQVLYSSSKEEYFSWEPREGGEPIRLYDAVGDSRGDVQVISAGATADAPQVFRTPAGDVGPLPERTYFELSADGAFATGYDFSGGGKGWTPGLYSTADAAHIPFQGLDGRPMTAAWTTGGRLVVLSIESGDEISADSQGTVSICSTDGRCVVPSDAPEGTLGDLAVQAGALGATWAMGDSSESAAPGVGEEDNATATTVGPPAE